MTKFVSFGMYCVSSSTNPTKGEKNICSDSHMASLVMMSVCKLYRIVAGINTIEI